MIDHSDKEFASRNLFVDQGDSFRQEITLTGSDSLPINLTDYTISGSIKRYLNTAEVIPIVTSITSPTLGKILLTIDEAETSKLKFERYIYEVKISGGSNVIRVLSGQILVNRF